MPPSSRGTRWIRTSFTANSYTCGEAKVIWTIIIISHWNPKCTVLWWNSVSLCAIMLCNVEQLKPKSTLMQLRHRTFCPLFCYQNSTAEARHTHASARAHTHTHTQPLKAAKTQIWPFPQDTDMHNDAAGFSISTQLSSGRGPLDTSRPRTHRLMWILDSSGHKKGTPIRTGVRWVGLLQPIYVKSTLVWPVSLRVCSEVQRSSGNWS